jgi:hypothetical protein
MKRSLKKSMIGQLMMQNHEADEIRSKRETCVSKYGRTDGPIIMTQPGGKVIM